MDAKQVIRSLMAKTGTSQEKLAKKSGMKGQSNITGILNRYASLRVDTMDQLVSAMGYKVMVVPEAVKCRDGWYEIGSRDEKEDANKNVEAPQDAVDAPSVTNEKIASFIAPDWSLSAMNSIW